MPNLLKSALWVLGIGVALLLMPLIGLLLSFIVCVIAVWTVIMIIKAMYDLENEQDDN